MQPDVHASAPHATSVELCVSWIGDQSTPSPTTPRNTLAVRPKWCPVSKGPTANVPVKLTAPL
jgi:hypothetical protein